MKSNTDVRPEAPGPSPESIDEALRRGDFDAAAPMVEEVAGAYVDGAAPREVSFERLGRWLDVLNSQRSRPWLRYYGGWVSASLRRQEAARTLLADAAAQFEADPIERRAFLMTRLGQAVIAERDDRLDEAAAAFVEARALLPGELPAAPGVEALARGWVASDPSGAAQFWIDAAAAWRAAGDVSGTARALHNLAFLAIRRGEPQLARRLAQESCQLKASRTDGASIANSRNLLGMAERMLGSVEAADDDLCEVRAIALRAGQPMLAAYALANLADVASDMGDFPLADLRWARSTQEKQALGDDYTLAHGWRCWARSQRRRGDVDRALERARQAWELRAPCPDVEERAELLAELGACLVAAGDLERATPMLAEAAALAEQRNAKATAAAVALHQGDAGDAAAAARGGALVERWSLRYLDRSSPGQRLDACCIGEFSLSVGGRPIPIHEWRSRRAAELVRVLTLHDAPVHADRILDWLWPASHNARPSLNAAVNDIRQSLAAAGADRDLLHRDGGRYRLGPFASTDVGRASRALAGADRARRAGRLELAAARLVDALDAWGDAELLAEDPYAAWASRARERWEANIVSARLDLVDIAIEIGDHRLAVAHARAAVEAEPTKEIPHRALIRALLAADDRPAAVSALERCKRRLRAETGVGPSSATVALVPPDPAE